MLYTRVLRVMFLDHPIFLNNLSNRLENISNIYFCVQTQRKIMIKFSHHLKNQSVNQHLCANFNIIDNYKHKTQQDNNKKTKLTTSDQIC